ncbi:ATP-binding protein [Kutzneria sp. CA-103260]|uniref:ATP-binding protein n=1 Tax=Kutzneria sp. CA-103260 TaxID=2802641 RepID=UPI001BA7807D|nr:AAA family ATPase [Kutzneria sp. CA-103260]QUQ71664.1 LuxR family transcriptional regulator [Kutzneria sp. CA-103260]
MLIGRSRELARLTVRVRELAGGRGGTALVDGEPGIGKTTLLRAVCDAALENGCRVHWGAGDELGRLLPLLPLLEALRAERSDEGQAVLRLLRGEIPTVADPSAVAAERVLGMVEELCSDGPAVLALDDLQWADKVTVAVFSRLVKLVDQLPLLLIGTLRPVPVRDDLSALWRQLGDDGQISLGPLPADAIGELVAQLVGTQPSDELLRHAEGAAGNPLYATELVSAVAEGATRPGSLAAAIDHRMDFLSEQTRHVLRAATLLGVVFSVADLSVVLGRSVVDLLPALDQATAAGVLVESGDGLSFRHALVRSALYERMSQPVRAAWHLEAARLLSNAGSPVERVAKQLLVASDADEWTVDWLCDNAGALIGQSPSAAVDLLRRVLATPSWDTRRLSLASRFGDALYRTGDFDEAEQVATRALALSVDPVQIVWLHHILLQCRSMSGRVAQSLVELDHALADPNTTGRVRARLLVLTARAHWDLGELDAAEKAALDAADAAPADEWAVGWSLHVRSIVLMVRNKMADALDLLDHAVRAIGRDGGTAELSLLLRVNRAVTLCCVDRYDEAVAAARDVRQLAEHVGNTVRMAQAQSALVQMTYDCCRWDDVLVDVDMLADELRNPVVAASDHSIAALIHLHRGDHVAAGRHLAVARAAQVGKHPVLHLALVNSLELEQAGQLSEALAALSMTADYDDLLPEIVRLAVADGDLDTARVTTSRVVGLAADSEVRHRIAAAAYCRGLVAGDGEELLRAATVYRECGLPLARAKALEAAAAAFVHNGQSSSARAAASRALDLYAELGAEWQLARAQAALRGLGLRRGPKVKHRRAKTGWDSLTPAEATVAQLVVAGLSNPQIAERLFVSRRTVTTHVSHILAKLQVRTRTDIAREAGLRQAASG